MVKEHSGATVLQQGVQSHELVALDLHLYPQVQIAQPLQERRSFGIKVSAQQRCIERHPHHARGLEVLQLA